MDINVNLIKKSNELKEKAKKLPKMSMKWQKPIKVDFKKLTTWEKLKNSLEILTDTKNYSAVYFSSL